MHVGRRITGKPLAYGLASSRRAIPSALPSSGAVAMSNQCSRFFIITVKGVKRFQCSARIREMPKQLAPESRSTSTPLEQALLAIWRKALRRDDVGVTDNVFQFGADPLRAE